MSYLVGELMMTDVEFIQSLEGETPAPQALISQYAPHMCFIEAIPLLQKTSGSGSCGLKSNEGFGVRVQPWVKSGTSCTLQSSR